MAYNFWVAWPGLSNIVPSTYFRHTKKTKKHLFLKIALGTRLQAWGYLGTLFCALETLGTSQKACVGGDSFDMNLSLCAVKEDFRKMRDLRCLSFWTNVRKKWGVTINISLILVVLLYNCAADINIRLMITEVHLEPSRTVTMGFFCKNSQGLKAINYFCKKAPS